MPCSVGFAGTLRQRVVVEALTDERNALAAQLPTWQVVARCLAAVAPDGAEAEAQALIAMARFLFGKAGPVLLVRLPGSGRAYRVAA